MSQHCMGRVVQLPVGELLDLIRPHPVLVQQHIVARRAGGTLDAGMAVQEVVELMQVCDPCVHHCPCSESQALQHTPAKIAEL